MSSDTKFGSNILAKSLKSLSPRKEKNINSSSEFLSRNLIADAEDSDDPNGAPDKTVSGS